MVDSAVELHMVPLRFQLLVDPLVLYCFLCFYFVDHLADLFVLVEDLLEGTLGLACGVVLLQVAAGILSEDDPSVGLGRCHDNKIR